MQNPLFALGKIRGMNIKGYNTKSIWVTHKLDITHNVMQLQKTANAVLYCISTNIMLNQKKSLFLSILL